MLFRTLQVEFMNIVKADFIISNTDLAKCPNADRPEFAFIGRSNVGKSSLINMLANKKELAKTSSTPGKTQLINHFNINDCMYWVDLPGYGYAKVSKSQRSAWRKMIYNYLENRENLLCLFVLIDSRHSPQSVDLEFLATLGERGIPFAIFFTKSDKSKQAEVQRNINDFNKALLKSWEELPPQIVTSAKKHRGKDKVLLFIEEQIAATKK
jgi:GTP-binding protein